MSLIDKHQQKDSPQESGAITPEAYRALMRHQAGAVTIVATSHAGQRTGLTATAFSSLSDTPPTILVCIQRTAGAHDAILASGVFSVNILTETQQRVAECFSGLGGIRGGARFEGTSWSTLKTNAPVLDGALACLDCTLADHHRFATHSIFIGTVVDGRMRAEAAPLLYFRGDYWNIGSSST